MKETEELARARAKADQAARICVRYWPEIKGRLETIAALEPTRWIVKDGKGIISFLWDPKTQTVLVGYEAPPVDCFIDWKED